MKYSWKTIANWGLYPRKHVVEYQFESKEELQLILQETFSKTLPKSLISYGMGRCYGDANLSNRVLNTQSWNKVKEFNEETGVITCQSGVSLNSILELIVPKGYFLPVTPGTKFISVGGALASDIHGKNHHVEGVFSDHVLYFKLVISTGEEVTVSRKESLFSETAGGMGLTGIITEVTFQLKKIETAYIQQKAIRAKNLRDIFNLFEQNQEYTYSVAWIDCLASGRNLGRSVLLLGEHASKESLKSDFHALKIHNKPILRIPFYFPSWVLNPFFVKVFNELYYRKPSSQGDSIVHYDPYFYPLDKIYTWNRIYGKKGFVQWQCVVPKEVSFEAMEQILGILSKNNLGSFLAVLKLFGKSHEDRELHFPMEGYTLALDIKIHNRIWDVLDELDGIVSQYGGRVYLTKDSRMNAENFAKQYPRINKGVIENKNFKSYQIERLMQNKKNVFLVLGANSDIAKATVLEFRRKYSDIYFILCSRNSSPINEFISDNNLDQNAEFQYFDALALDTHSNFIKVLRYKPRWILYSAGILVENNQFIYEGISQLNENQLSEDIIQNYGVNFYGGVSILTHLINDNNPFLERIIGISSVAGIRGRKSNFMYGSAKAGFHQYLFGLRQILKDRDIVVQSVTPGFVVSKMTQHLTLPKVANKPEDVAKAIVNKKNTFEIYPNTFWRIIGLVLKFAPEFIVKKL